MYDGSITQGLGFSELARSRFQKVSDDPTVHDPAFCGNPMPSQWLVHRWRPDTDLPSKIFQIQQVCGCFYETSL